MYLESPPPGAPIMALCRSCKRGVAVTKRDVTARRVVLVKMLNADSCPLCEFSFRQVEWGLRELAKELSLAFDVQT